MDALKKKRERERKKARILRPKFLLTKIIGGAGLGALAIQSYPTSEASLAICRAS